MGERDHFRGTQIFGGKGIECHTFPELCYFPRDTDTFATWRLQKIPNLGIFFHAVKNANAPRPNLVTRNMRWQGERAHKVASYSHYHMGCIRDSYTLVLPEQQHGLIWLQKMLMLTKNIFGVVVAWSGSNSLPCRQPGIGVVAIWQYKIPLSAAAQANQRKRMTDTLGTRGAWREGRR